MIWTGVIDAVKGVAVSVASLTAILLIDAAQAIMRRVPRTFGQGPKREDEYL